MTLDLPEAREFAGDDESFLRNLARRIQLGEAAIGFLNTPLGKYLMTKAQDTAIEAMDKLKTVDPADQVEIRACQNAIFRAESFELWINECIEDAEVADQEMAGVHQQRSEQHG